MGYEKIKELISDIDEFYNEAELREVLQEILFICEEEIKPTTIENVEKMYERNLVTTYDADKKEIIVERED